MNYIAQSPVVPLVELTESSCHYPIGDPREDDFGFCGAVKRQGSPYCEHHHKLAYKTERERAPSPVPQIAASWTTRRTTWETIPIRVWRPRCSSQPEIILPAVVTHESLVEAHKRRQAKYAEEARQRERLAAEREALNAKARKAEELRYINMSCAVSAFLRGAADGIRGCPKKINIKSIHKVVADYYKIDVNEIVSDRRQVTVTRPRHVAMYLAKTLTPNSYPEIGRRFGDRDHTTIMHGVRKITELIEVDPILRVEIEELKEALGWVGQ